MEQPLIDPRLVQGLTDYTRDVIVGRHTVKLVTALKRVRALAPDEKLITPPINLIFEAFRLCPIERARVILIGQDPFIKPGEAMGLSFSVSRGVAVPPSTRNIYECLQRHNLLGSAPSHGDLSNWAKQGILMLNTALTTRLHVSRAHAKCWDSYTDAIIEEISKTTGRKLIYLMLGKDAQAKINLVNTAYHVVLSWGHPSPLNGANRSGGAEAFRNCPHFAKINTILVGMGEAPINWDPNKEPIIDPTSGILARFICVDDGIGLDPDARMIAGLLIGDTTGTPLEEVPQIEEYRKTAVVTVRDHDVNVDPFPLTYATLWIFTDGAARANGRDSCFATWAYIMTDGTKIASAADKVIETPTNNRGELTAILCALEYIESITRPGVDCPFDFEEIRFISDSSYSIGCINVWVNTWIQLPETAMKGKKNLDLIIPAKTALDNIRKQYPVKFTHVNSHVKAPPDETSEAWFIWRGNAIVDKMCTDLITGGE